MTFQEFQATAQTVDLRNHDEIMAQMGTDAEGPIPGRLYADNLYIEINANGSYCLTIGNDSRVSEDLARLELDLYDFAVCEGYIAEA